MNDQNVLAKKIIDYRESLNMSQAGLSDKTGIERTALNKIEKGIRKVSSNELIAIAKALHQSADTLLGLNVKKSDSSNNYDKNIFGVRLKLLRESKKWSKTYAAKMLHIPLSTYANYEYGEREPNIETMRKMATAYDTSIDYLAGKIDDPNFPSEKFSSSDLNHTLASAESFDGKSITSHDRDVIKAYLQGYFSNK